MLSRVVHASRVIPQCAVHAASGLRVGACSCYHGGGGRVRSGANGHEQRSSAGNARQAGQAAGAAAAAVINLVIAALTHHVLDAWRLALPTAPRAPTCLQRSTGLPHDTRPPAKAVSGVKGAKASEWRTRRASDYLQVLPRDSLLGCSSRISIVSPPSTRTPRARRGRQGGSPGLLARRALPGA
jgi:hypothetical protein